LDDAVVKLNDAMRGREEREMERKSRELVKKGDKKGDKKRRGK
jgi:hypothetical protein